MEKTKIILDENELPKQWYNILPDLQTPLEPPLNPATNEPIGPDDLSPIPEISSCKAGTSRWFHSHNVNVPVILHLIANEWVADT